MTKARWDWPLWHLLIWLVLTMLILGVAFLVMDFLEVDDRVRLLALVLLATLIVVSFVWRAVGALARLIEHTLSARQNYEIETTPPRNKE